MDIEPNINGEGHCCYPNIRVAFIHSFIYSRSPLNQVDSMFGKTLIFVGDDDTTVVPESQGIALYKALHHRNVTTALYHYPGEFSRPGFCRHGPI